MFYQHIPPQRLDALQHYKYTGTDLSLLANTVLKYYWNWVTDHIFPLWIAPNVITLMGLICLFLNYITTFYFCPVLPGCEPPRWFYLFVAVNIFLYQTFDNVDGKQARRTGTSSALGELFDHGCDSLFLMLTGPATFCAVRAEVDQMYSLLTIGFVAFFFSHWEEYHTNVLILGKLGNPTEVQWALISVFLSSFFLGPDVWRLPLSAILPRYVTSTLLSLRARHPLFTYLTLPLEWRLNSRTSRCVVVTQTTHFLSFTLLMTTTSLNFVFSLHFNSHTSFRFCHLRMVDYYSRCHSEYCYYISLDVAKRPATHLAQTNPTSCPSRHSPLISDSMGPLLHN
jgi:phosphatidylglycerophosphate synthase